LSQADLGIGEGRARFGERKVEYRAG